MILFFFSSFSNFWVVHLSGLKFLSLHCWLIFIPYFVTFNVNGLIFFWYLALWHLRLSLWRLREVVMFSVDFVTFTASCDIYGCCDIYRRYNWSIRLFEFLLFILLIWVTILEFESRQAVLKKILKHWNLRVLHFSSRKWYNDGLVSKSWQKTHQLNIECHL